MRSLPYRSVYMERSIEYYHATILPLAIILCLALLHPTPITCAGHVWTRRLCKPEGPQPPSSSCTIRVKRTHQEEHLPSLEHQSVSLTLHQAYKGSFDMLDNKRAMAHRYLLAVAILLLLTAHAVHARALRAGEMVGCLSCILALHCH